MEDQPVKDAFAAADVPAKVTWLAYADIQRLAPILQALAALTGNGQSKPSAGAEAREVRDARRFRRSVRLDEQGRSAAHDPVVRRLGLLVAALALLLAGCGGTTGPGSGGADFVPASVPLFVAINTDLGSSQWHTVNELANKFPDKQKAIDSIKQQLLKNGLDWERRPQARARPGAGPRDARFRASRRDRGADAAEGPGCVRGRREERQRRRPVEQARLQAVPRLDGHIRQAGRDRRLHAGERLREAHALGGQDLHERDGQGR